MNWNPYLLENIYLGNYVYLNYFTLVLVLISMFLALFSIWMLVKAGFGYPVERAQADANIYGGVIYEAHGGMTVFLWAYFAFMFIWTIIYFLQHAAEFNIWFAY
jgi:hypothetical protein